MEKEKEVKKVEKEPEPLKVEVQEEITHDDKLA